MTSQWSKADSARVKELQSKNLVLRDISEEAAEYLAELRTLLPRAVAEIERLTEVWAFTADEADDLRQETEDQAVEIERLKALIRDVMAGLGMGYWIKARVNGLQRVEAENSALKVKLEAALSPVTPPRRFERAPFPG